MTNFSLRTSAQGRKWTPNVDNVICMHAMNQLILPQISILCKIVQTNGQGGTPTCGKGKLLHIFSFSLDLNIARSIYVQNFNLRYFTNNSEGFMNLITPLTVCLPSIAWCFIFSIFIEKGIQSQIC